MSAQVQRVAVVTGGGSGIGAAVGHALAADGWTVVLAGRRLAALEAVAASGRAELGGSPQRDAAGGTGAPGSLEGIATDVTDEDSVRALFDTTVHRHGRVDLLFNNAGTAAPAVLLDQHDLATWNAVVAVNLTGAFLCTREAFRVMRRQRPQGGRIINNGSLAAHTPRPRSIAYTATKHAITGLTKSTSLDGRPFDIAAGQIDIGNAATEMAAGSAVGATQADGSVRPEPLMDVAEVGRAVRYMASLPLDGNVATMTVMATKMPYVGRG
jgi:NAD(P)-dependent dehydrogenase (short-subunit alcohol dehydrogenase family)